MRPLMITAFLATLTTGLSAPVMRADYHGVDEKGVRIFSAVPQVGVHPRVLIMPLGPGIPRIKVEEYAASFARGKANRARRLIILRTGTEGRFCVLLYPFRTTVDSESKDARALWQATPLGAETPQVGQTRTGFWIKTKERKDDWRIAPGIDGRSRIRMQCRGKIWELE